MKKEIPLKFEEKDYLCKLESTDSNLINIILSRDSLPEYKGNIDLKIFMNKFVLLMDIQWKKYFQQ